MTLFIHSVITIAQFICSVWFSQNMANNVNRPQSKSVYHYCSKIFQFYSTSISERIFNNQRKIRLNETSKFSRSAPTIVALRRLPPLPSSTVFLSPATTLEHGQRRRQVQISVLLTLLSIISRMLKTNRHPYRPIIYGIYMVSIIYGLLRARPNHAPFWAINYLASPPLKCIPFATPLQTLFLNCLFPPY